MEMVLSHRELASDPLRTRHALALYGSSESVLARWGRSIMPAFTAAEKHRAASFRQLRDRNDYIAAHVLVRVAVERMTGVSAKSVVVRQHCESCGGAHGRPHVDTWPAVCVSLSHTRGVVAAAVSYTSISIDAELRQFCIDDSVIDSFATSVEAQMLRNLPTCIGVRRQCSTRQLAALRLWLRKEALVKMGLVSLDSLTQVDLSAVPLVGEFESDRTVFNAYGQWIFTDWTDPRVDAAFSVLSGQRTEVVMC
jgi:4'-phosphopantetheinyl transferase